MMRHTAVATLSSLIVTAAAAQMIPGGPSQAASTPPYSFTPVAPGQHNVALATAAGLSVPLGATYAVVQAKGASVEYTCDGMTTPTATVGTMLQSGSAVALQGPIVLANFRAYSAHGTIDVEYFK